MELLSQMCIPCCPCTSFTTDIYSYVKIVDDFHKLFRPKSNFFWKTPQLLCFYGTCILYLALQDLTSLGLHFIILDSETLPYNNLSVDCCLKRILKNFLDPSCSIC